MFVYNVSFLNEIFFPFQIEEWKEIFEQKQITEFS